MLESTEPIETPIAFHGLQVPNNPGRVGIFSLVEPQNYGGLEAYIRTLSSELIARDVAVHWNGGLPATEISLAETWRPRVTRLLPAMTRKPIRFIAHLYALFVGGASCKRAITNCDIVHFVGTGWDLIGFPLERAVRNQRKLMSCWPAIHPGRWGDAPLDLDLYRRMDAVFAQTDFERDYLVQCGVPRDKLVNCGCAPASEATGNGARFRRNHGLDDKQVVLFVGRKSREKGYHALRSAVSQLASAGRPVVLVSIGQEVDPPFPNLPAEVDIDLRAADELVKQDAFAACDVFALPSAAEAFGIVYVEAWSYGKPVICGTAPASRELISKHEGGLATDGSPGEILERLQKLLNDSELRLRLGNNGKQAVSERYTGSVIVQTHLQCWSSLRRK